MTECGIDSKAAFREKDIPEKDIPEQDFTDRESGEPVIGDSERNSPKAENPGDVESMKNDSNRNDSEDDDSNMSSMGTGNSGMDNLSTENSEKENRHTENLGTESSGMDNSSSVNSDMDISDTVREAPAVSVIMPIYNAERFLRGTLKSILSQTLQNIEVICVDDGSSDDSGDILEEFAKLDERVHTVHTQNRGAGAARNTGLRLARGKYVVFWDADDEFRKDALEKMSARCELFHADICLCAARKKDDETGTVYASGAYLNKKLLPGNGVFNRKTLPQYIFTISTNVPWNKMLRRDFLISKGIHFQEIDHANDVYFSMIALYRAQRICYVKDALVIYRVENRGSLTGEASKHDLCTVEAFWAVKKTLRKSADFMSDLDHYLRHRKSSADKYPERLSASLSDNSGYRFLNTNPDRIGPKLRQSFDNRAADALLYSLRKQWNVEVYRYLYNIYKTEVFPEFGLTDHDQDYFYNKDNYADIEQMKVLEADQFLLYLYHKYERKYMMASGMTLGALAQKAKRRIRPGK